MARGQIKMLKEKQTSLESEWLPVRHSKLTSFVLGWLDSFKFTSFNQMTVGHRPDKLGVQL